MVPQNHPVRVLQTCLELVDWKPWEKRYASRRGQPPIHPRLMAGCILYGLIRGLRSSRDLEEATRERVDFMWFLEMRSIDHSTFAQFRTQFGEELKLLNRDIVRQVCARQEDSLLQFLLDGTRIRANSSRHETRTAQGLEKLIAQCAEELDRKLARLQETDAQAQEQEKGPSLQAEVAQLQSEVETLRKQADAYRKALEIAQARDAVRKAHNGNKAKAVQVPLADPDAQVTPNKEGGFAPNYTPVAGVDAATRMIVSQDVLEGSDENASVLPAVEAAEECTGKKVQQVLADGNFAGGANLEALEQRGTEAYMPTGAGTDPANPVLRADLGQPVSEEQWGVIPKHGKYFSAAAFVYDACQNCYYCPMGKMLTPAHDATDRNGARYTLFRCPGAAGCPLASQCVRGKASARTLRRGEHQEVRERTAARMATQEGKAVFAKRAPIMEGVFGEIKHILGVRQFLLRGLEKVRIEWNWICGAFNLKRWMNLLLQEQARKEPDGGASKQSGNELNPLPVQQKLLRTAHLAHGDRVWSAVNHEKEPDTKLYGCSYRRLAA